MSKVWYKLHFNEDGDWDEDHYRLSTTKEGIKALIDDLERISRRNELGVFDSEIFPPEDLVKGPFESVELLAEVPPEIEEESDDFDWFPIMVGVFLLCIFLMLYGLGSLIYDLFF